MASNTSLYSAHLNRKGDTPSSVPPLDPQVQEEKLIFLFVLLIFFALFGRLFIRDRCGFRFLACGLHVGRENSEHYDACEAVYEMVRMPLGRGLLST